MSNPTIIYKIDSNDTLADLNELWDQFATENDAADFLSQNIQGRSLWDYIYDLDTRHLYEAILKHVRQHDIMLQFPYRCDSPAFKRFMHMEIYPDQNGKIIFQNEITRIEPRNQKVYYHFVSMGRRMFLRLCSVCLRVKHDNVWHEIEDALNMGILDNDRQIQVACCVCDECKQTIMDELNSSSVF